MPFLRPQALPAQKQLQQRAASETLFGVLSAVRIGGPLLFSRLWERLGIAEVLGDLLKIRGFEFAVERSVFVSVLHRLFVSGSDRACENWMADYKIDGIEGLQLHHLYRAMPWLGEEIEERAEGGLSKVREGSDRGTAVRSPPRSVH